jgi:hypothetical protein
MSITIQEGDVEITTNIESLYDDIQEQVINLKYFEQIAAERESAVIYLRSRKADADRTEIYNYEDLVNFRNQKAELENAISDAATELRKAREIATYTRRVLTELMKLVGGGIVITSDSNGNTYEVFIRNGEAGVVSRS